MKLVALMAVLVLPAVIHARPITKVLEMEAGTEEFFHSGLKAVGSDNPSVATVELLPSQEVLVTAVRPGRALIYLVGETRLEVVRLGVIAQGVKAAPLRAREEQRSAARRACLGWKEEGPENERFVTAIVSTAACRAALRDLMAADEYSTARMALSFSPETLLDQLMAIRKALAEKKLDEIQVAYSGLTLILKGSATAEQKLELMKLLYDGVLGPVLFEDETASIAPPRQERAGAFEPAQAQPPASKVPATKSR